MREKTKVKLICIMSAVLLITLKNSSYSTKNEIPCGKISDYVYEDENSNIIVSNRNAEKKVALTFDDGPSSRYTSNILNTLKHYNVKATFFIIGENAENNPELLKTIHNEGHEIGNHTYSHPNMRKLSPEQIDEEIRTTQKIIQEITGVTPELFRPPGGYLNNTIVEKITSNHCKTVLWTWQQDTMDWKCPSVDQIVNTVLSNIRDGDIILFHDYNPGDSPTPRAIEIIIPKLLAMGYKPVTVSELI